MTVNLNKFSLDGIHSLSCIESYVLAVLHSNLHNADFLYYQSFLPFAEIYDEFFDRNTLYAYFTGFPRVQDIAREKHIIELNIEKNVDFESVFHDEKYVCIGVSPAYLIRKYGEKAWRDDHYILVFKQDKSNCFYINDNPRDDGIISAQELQSAFSGQIIRFEMIGEITPAMQAEFFDSFRSRLFVANDRPVNFNLISDNDLIKTRDFVGILRISRKRAAQFLNCFMSSEFMQTHIESIDKVYTTLEYMRLRRHLDRSKAIELLTDTWQADLSITKTIINDLRD